MNVFKYVYTGELNKKEYTKVYLMIARILRPDLNANEREKLVEKDWIRDS